MDIKRKAIAIKLSKEKSKNGFNLFRLKDGRFFWMKEPKYKPHWQLDCII